jgi:hypothetical protein
MLRTKKRQHCCYRFNICRATWIRTMTNRVRVWYATVTLSLYAKTCVETATGVLFFNVAKVMHFSFTDKYNPEIS